MRKKKTFGADYEQRQVGHRKMGSLRTNESMVCKYKKI